MLQWRNCACVSASVNNIHPLNHSVKKQLSVYITDICILRTTYQTLSRYQKPFNMYVFSCRSYTIYYCIVPYSSFSSPCRNNAIMLSIQVWLYQVPTDGCSTVLTSNMHQRAVLFTQKDLERYSQLSIFNWKTKIILTQEIRCKLL